ncbi:hypothetical protein F2Q70_00042766 [Brassica cretica]|uniref:Uncharacterized protein n=1 Tax=Brassica cretica TaxID=69181 RepID=A0A3N6RZQ3_BRACR|nr:hypothetical protein F2Q70_00042766 [Brassica cretica]KAF3518681.1 hypothetical protein DY000_02059264 [Brassica cretica]
MGEPMTNEELQNALPNFQAPTMVQQSTHLEVEPLNIWRDMTHEETYLNCMMYEDAHMRVSAPQPATIIIIDKDDDGSYTGSSDRINNNDNITTVSPTEVMGPIVSDHPKNDPTVMKGDSSAGGEKQNTPASPEFVIATPPVVNASNAGLCLDLTLGI